MSKLTREYIKLVKSYSNKEIEIYPNVKIRIDENGILYINEIVFFIRAYDLELIGEMLDGKTIKVNQFISVESFRKILYLLSLAEIPCKINRHGKYRNWVIRKEVRTYEQN